MDNLKSNLGIEKNMDTNTIKFSKAQLYILEAFTHRETIKTSRLAKEMHEKLILHKSNTSRALSDLVDCGLLKKISIGKNGTIHKRQFCPKELGILTLSCNQNISIKENV